VFLLLVAATRYVSAGSLGAAVTLPFFIMFTTPCDPVIWGSIIAICLLAIWRHAPNIRRLMNHTESKINLGKGKKAV
ncbi:MAG: glycerol-3-phosphate acyltransferase, partial [Christensenellales bacterium]